MRIFDSELRNRWAALAISIVAIGVAIFLPAATTSPTSGDGTGAKTSSSANYPFTLCPAALGTTMRIGLTNSHLQIRSINGKSTSTHTSQSATLNSYQYSSASPLYVQGSAGIPTAWSTSTSGSGNLVGVPCNSGGQSQWLVGGSAALTSQDLLEVINSGPTQTAVMVYPFTSKGPLAPVTFAVKANSDTQIPVSTITPGENSIALEVVSQSARIASYLLDHRKSGLSDLGSSFVAEQDQPQSTIYLGGISNGSYSGSKASTQMIRFLDPGTLDAHITATVYTSNGALVPVGLSSLTLSHQKVLDLALPTAQMPSPYGIMIQSDQPIVASVLTSSVLSRDFTWASALTPLATSKYSATRINFAGAKPTIVFIGAHIQARLSWQPLVGKTATAVVSGDLITSWVAPVNISNLTITPVSGQQAIYAGAILGGNSHASMSYLSIGSAAPQVGSAAPTSDIRALIPNTR